MSRATSAIRPVGIILALAIGALSAVPARASAAELATAQGTIAIREAPAGQRSPTCAELVVEARDALDNHLIGLTHAEDDASGVCRYALSVPAQSAVWLHPRPVLVDSVRSAAAEIRSPADSAPARGPLPSATRERVSTASVQLRFRIVAPETQFFAPGERKTVSLTY